MQANLDAFANDFVAGATVAIASAFLGYWGAVAQARRERGLRKVAVATALLTELQWLERIVRQLAEDAEAARSKAPLPTAVHEQFRHEFIVFHPKTIALLLELRGFLGDVEHERQKYTDAAQIDKGTHGWVRFKAACVAEVIPELRVCLESEGGRVTPEIPRAASMRGGQPKLPPPAFPKS